MINAAIVGLGRYGQILVESVQNRSESIRFTAAVTRTPAKAAEFAACHGIPLGDDYEAVLADAAIDAVVLATPHSQHAGQVTAAAAAGKHIFVEKPFTLTRASAEAAVAAADQAGVTLALGHNRRFLPAFAELRRRLDAGALGTAMHVEANYSGPGALRFRAGMWRAERAESPSGGMAGMGIHMVDAMISLFGPIAEVQVRSVGRVVAVDIDDTTAALLGFKNGMNGTLVTVAATAPDWRLQVFGSKGWAEIRGETRFEFRPLEGESEVIDHDFVDTQRAELEAFAAAVRGEADYPLPLRDAVNGVAVFEAINRSAHSGGMETVA
jgi:predicted dehydrogenase